MDDRQQQYKGVIEHYVSIGFNYADLQRHARWTHLGGDEELLLIKGGGSGDELLDVPDWMQITEDKKERLCELAYKHGAQIPLNTSLPELNKKVLTAIFSSSYKKGLEALSIRNSIIYGQ